MKCKFQQAMSLRSAICFRISHQLPSGNKNTTAGCLSKPLWWVVTCQARGANPPDPKKSIHKQTTRAVRVASNTYLHIPNMKIKTFITIYIYLFIQLIQISTFFSFTINNISLYGGFHKWGISQNGLFIGENHGTSY